MTRSIGNSSLCPVHAMRNAWRLRRRRRKLPGRRRRRSARVYYYMIPTYPSFIVSRAYVVLTIVCVCWDRRDRGTGLGRLEASTALCCMLGTRIALQAMLILHPSCCRLSWPRWPPRRYLGCAAEPSKASRERPECFHVSSHGVSKKVRQSRLHVGCVGYTSSSSLPVRRLRLHVGCKSWLHFGVILVGSALVFLPPPTAVSLWDELCKTILRPSMCVCVFVV